MQCKDCKKKINSDTPISKCKCGCINIMRRQKYIIDFTVENHGEIVILATSPEKARAKFAHMIKEHKKETAQFVTNLVYDYSIRENYCYKDGVPNI